MQSALPPGRCGGVPEGTAKPVIAVWMGGKRAAVGRRILMRNSVPAYATPEEAVKTYLYMYHYRRNIELLYETPAEQARTNPPLRNYLKEIVRKAVREQRRALGAGHALDLLKEYRIPTIPTAVVSNVDHVRMRIQDIGLPLSLKVRSPRDGGEEQIISLTTDEEADRACEEARRRFGFDDAGNPQDVEILLQKGENPGNYSLKLESRRDPEFRTILVLSPHPASVEDIYIALPPLNKTLVRRLLEEAGVATGAGDGETGQQALARLEDAILGFSNLVVDFAEIERIEVVLSVGETDVLAADVSVILARDYDDSDPYAHLVIRPYPSHYITQWKLPDGTGVLLRPIRPEDESMGRDMFATLSKETLRVRFFGAPSITHDFLVRFCNIDYDREIAINAEIEKDGKRRIIGGCRLILDPDSGKALFAILVHDDYRRMGLGAKLIDILVGIAKEKQLDEIYGEVLSENHGMLALCRKLGFEVSLGSQGVSTVRLPLRA